RPRQQGTGEPRSRRGGLRRTTRPAAMRAISARRLSRRACDEEPLATDRPPGRDVEPESREGNPAAGIVGAGHAAGLAIVGSGKLATLEKHRQVEHDGVRERVERCELDHRTVRSPAALDVPDPALASSAAEVQAERPAVAVAAFEAQELVAALPAPMHLA